MNNQRIYSTHVLSTVDLLEAVYPIPCQSMSIQDLYPIASELHESLLDVRIQINRLAIVHKLPDELLYLVFKHLLLRREEYPGYDLYERQENFEADTLISLTHVCGRWRTLLLHAPQFWAQLGYSYPGQFTAFLKRSGSVPLSLVVKDSTPGLRDVLSEHGWRLKRFDLTITSDFLSLVSFPLSLQSLECLTLSVDRDCDTIPGLGPRSLLFMQLSLGLKALALCPVPGWLPADHFPALTHLYVCDSEDVSLRIPNALSLISLLASAPALQFVHISNFVLDADDPVPPATPTIVLSQLRSLVLIQCGVEVIDLLAHLSLPVQVFVRLSEFINVEEGTNDRAFTTVPRHGGYGAAGLGGREG
ncbi:hypothetical protein C8T65DRAFT_126004 [Cerioporus squamosus]|nr:hypothetical protein C8T65DRAFT_126004 [Cerioporus squamosus]